MSHFRLAIWRPAQPERYLCYFPGASSGSPSSFQVEDLHEEVYSWDPGEDDVWASFNDGSTSDSLRSALVRQFAPDVPPTQRSMRHFATWVAQLRQALASGDTALWGETQQEVITRDQTLNLRSNLALGLLLHVEWLVEVFEHLPGASVSVR